MAVTLQCPRCTHKMKVDDDKANKAVPCKICHHPIKPVASNEKPKAKADPDAKKESGASIKAGTPGANGKAKAAAPPMVTAAPEEDEETPRSRKKRFDDDDDEDIKSKKRRRDEDDDDDDEDERPTPRRKKEGGGGGMVLVLGGVAALLVLFVLCGGGAIGGFYLFSGGENEQIAQIDPPRDLNPPPIVIQIPNPQPMPFPNPPPVPFPNPDPFPRPPIGGGNPFNPPENLDPNDPNNIDRVITLLNGAENERPRAYTWLNAANENHKRRKEVAGILDRQVSDYLLNPPTFGNDGMFNAFFKWATKDNVPTLGNVAEKTRFTVWDNRYREDAMKTLGKMKDPRGADALIKNLGNHFFGGGASNALREMGPVAEPAVLKIFNSPDGKQRSEARKLIQAYNTRNDLIVGQCIVDLNSDDNNRRNGAVNWFTTAPVEAKRKQEVARALNKAIPNANFFFEKDLIKALEVWGTADNVPPLVQRLEANKTGNNEVIHILGKIRDINGMKAVAKSMGNFFNQGEAKKVLREYGPGAEALVVEQMNITLDGQARRAYVQFLGEIGTRNSLPSLQQLAFRNQQDRILQNDIQAATKAIAARGK